jgi:sulfonate transport system permease protein
LLPLLLAVSLLGLWQLSSSYGWLPARVLPAPLEVLQAAWKLVLSGEFWSQVKVSIGLAPR